MFNRIIKRLYTLDTYLSYQKVILNNIIECSDIIDVLYFFKKSDLLENSKFDLLMGIITYYMSDPSVCYKIFDEKVDAAIPTNLMGQYYFILSCENYLFSESDSVLKGRSKMQKNLLIIAKIRMMYFNIIMLVLYFYMPKLTPKQ